MQLATSKHKWFNHIYSSIPIWDHSSLKVMKCHKEDRPSHDYSTCFIVCSLFVNNLIYTMLCFVKSVLEMMLNGLAHDFYCLKACEISKGHAHSHKIRNESCTSSKYKNTDKKL